MADLDAVKARGLSFTPAHFPDRAPIDSYGNGGFRFAEMSHKGSILCLPSGIYGWNVDVVLNLIMPNFEQVFLEKNLELILIGTGNESVALPRDLINAFAEHGQRADVMSTGAAARTYNVLLAEGRSVGAALLAVE